MFLYGPLPASFLHFILFNSLQDLYKKLPIDWIQTADFRCQKWLLCQLSHSLYNDKNGSSPASFSIIFSLFKHTIQFLQQINVK